MHTFKTSAIALLLASALWSCAPTSNFPSIDPQLAEQEAQRQRIEALRKYVAMASRLHNVAFAIVAANAALCGDKTTSLSGFLPTVLEAIDREWWDAHRELHGATDAPFVISVAKGSPAATAGLQVRDILHAINGTELGTGKRSITKMSKLFSQRVVGDDPLTFTVSRGGEIHALEIGTVEACDYPVQLVARDEVNAYADGNAVYVTAGMAKFADDDLSLALVVGHELAHNSRGHIEAKTGNMLLGGLFGALATVATGVDMTNLGMQVGAGAFSPAFEAEADYVGVYHAARAGFDVGQAAAFWRRMAERNPQAIHLAGTTHPSTATRFLAIEKAAAEIAAKRAAGKPLVPEEK